MKSHIWIEHHRLVNTIHYQCLRCKRFAFHFEPLTNHKGHLPKYKLGCSLQEKFEETLQFWKKGLGGFGGYSFNYLDFEMKNLENTISYNCDELDVRDILL